MSLAIESCPTGFPVDEVYARLVAMGAGRSDSEARERLAALVFLLINHLGDPAIVFAAIDKVESIYSAKAPAP